MITALWFLFGTVFFMECDVFCSLRFCRISLCKDYWYTESSTTGASIDIIISFAVTEQIAAASSIKDKQQSADNIVQCNDHTHHHADMRL